MNLVTGRLAALRYLGPGLLVAATGVGAGDLATGAFAGNKLGITVLWACFVGAFLKYVLNEGIARWQLASGVTYLEGLIRYVGSPIACVFLLYLFAWSFFVGSALMSACGVTAHAILPIFSPDTDKIIYGIIHSGLAVVLILAGGYRGFERVMRVCIGLMFVTVLVAASVSRPAWHELAAGMFLPRVAATSEAWSWTIALMGGVGGTVTIICYGYWIREENRTHPSHLTVCRWDLATGYFMTGLFGMSMVILGSQIPAEGTGSRLLVNLAHHLLTVAGPLGAVLRWAFLLGAWSAVFSSLLGVWQSVPYLFTDLCNLFSCSPRQGKPMPVRSDSWPYRLYLLAIAVVPAIGLQFSFQNVQKIYAIIGACFLPLLAASLLWLNGWSERLERKYRNSLVTSLVLVAIMIFFALYGWIEVKYRLGG